MGYHSRISLESGEMLVEGRRPRVLDLYCGAGGASMGYHQAGFDVAGVDIEPQPDYPFIFIEADALEVLDDIEFCNLFDVVHASPPCQSSTALTKGTNFGRKYPNLIPQTREKLSRLDAVTVIENVQGAEVRKDLVLCGEMFGLDVIRHRYFEIDLRREDGAVIPQPKHKPHRGRVRGWRHGRYYDGPYLAVYGDGGGKGSIEEWQRAMGMPWVKSKRGLAEAIPPAFSHYVADCLRAIGSYLIG